MTTKKQNKASQKSLEVWIFSSLMEAVENAVYISGHRSDVSRSWLAGTIFDGETWKTGTEVPSIEGGNPMRSFSIRGTNGQNYSFVMETYEEGFCLWILDGWQGGVIHILSHTMEDMEGWDERNDNFFFDLKGPQDTAQLN